MADLHIRHDYTMVELHRLACMAVQSAGPLAGDWQDRYETAWCAIAEELYVSCHRPSNRDLVFVGRTAIFSDARAYKRHHGYHTEFGAGSSAAFVKFWHMFWSVPSCEERVIEQLGLAQVLDSMPSSHKETLVALAVWGNQNVAAVALGLSYEAFTMRLYRARADFRRRWFEGETPSGAWHPSPRASHRMKMRRLRSS